MTDAQLAALIRPRLAEAIELGRKLEREAQSRTFSDTHEPADGAVRPTSFYAGAGFTADDCERFSDYFSEDDDGYFAADLHRYFGLSVKDFADRSHLVRKQITNKNGNKQWVWVSPNKGKHAGKDDTPVRTPEYHPTRDAETAVAKAVNDPHSLTADHLEQLEAHLDVLPRDRLRDLARQVSAKLGKVKADLVQNVLAKVRAQHDPSQAPGAALERGYDITVPKGGLEPGALFGRQRRAAIAKAAQERGDTPKERTPGVSTAAPKSVPSDAKAIGDRIDAILNKGGELDKAQEQLRLQNSSYEFATHIRGLRDGSGFVVTQAPGGDPRHAVEVAGPFKTEDEADAAWVQLRDEYIAPHKKRLDDLRKEADTLRAKEDELQNAPAGPAPQPTEVAKETPLPVDEQHVKDIESARVADQKFKGEGRYESEVWQKLRKKNPGAPLPPLSKDAAEWTADEYERDGKPVPPEVLKDHPDLAAKYGTPAPAEQPVSTPPADSIPGPSPEGIANPPAALPSPAPTPAPHTLSKHEAGLAHLAQQRDKLRAGVAAARQHATSATDPQGKAHGDAVASALQKQLDALSATDDVSRPGAADAHREPVYQAYKAGQSQHHVAVESALKAGQDVPAHVLADYPDLAKKYGKAGA